MFFLSSHSIEHVLRLFKAAVIEWLRVCYEFSRMEEYSPKPKREDHEWTNGANI